MKRCSTYTMHIGSESLRAQIKGCLHTWEVSAIEDCLDVMLDQSSFFRPDDYFDGTEQVSLKEAKRRIDSLRRLARKCYRELDLIQKHRVDVALGREQS